MSSQVPSPMSDASFTRSPRLPVELLDKACAFLQGDRANGTLAAVQQSDKALYSTATNYLYRELALTQHSIAALLKLLAGIKVKDRYQLYRIMDQHTFSPNRQWSFDTYSPIVRLRASMMNVRGIIINEIEETSTLKELIKECDKFLGPMVDITSQHFIPRLRDLAITPGYMRGLEQGGNKPPDLLTLISRLSQPDRVCVQLSPSTPLFTSTPWYNALDGLSYIDATQITLHNVTNHPIRRTKGAPYGIPGEQIHLTIHFVEPPTKGNSSSGGSGQTRESRVKQISNPIREAIRLAILPAASPPISVKLSDSDDLSGDVEMMEGEDDSFLATYTFFHPLAGVNDLNPLDLVKSDLEQMDDLAQEVTDYVLAPDSKRDGEGPSRKVLLGRMRFLQGEEADRTTPCWGRPLGYC